MTCHEARQRLAAYRRDEWTAADMRALSEHLGACAACRKVEAAYRRVGESLRQLPAITPPPAFKEAVFAAIAADQRKVGPAALRASRAETEPSLPVVRAPVTPIRPRRAERRVAGRMAPAARVAFGAAAVVAVGLLATQFIPALGMGDLSANLFRGTSSVSAEARVSHYTPDATFHSVTSLRATSQWLAYSATDSAGATMLFVIDRHSGAARRLLATPSGAGIQIYALTPHWLIWGDAGAGGGAARVTALTGPGAGQTRTLAQATGAGAALDGVWADDQRALVAERVAGGSELLSLPVAGGAATLLAQGSAPGAAITNPVAEGGVVYWDEVWSAQGHLRGALWRLNGGAPTRETHAGDAVYALVAASDRLAWLSPAQAPAGGAPDTAALGALARTTRGAVRSLDLRSGAVTTLAATGAAPLAAGGAVIAWGGSAGATQTWDVSAGAPLAITHDLAGASVVGATDGALAWFDGSRLSVYNEA